MRLATILVFFSLFMEVSSDGWYLLFKEVIHGTWVLWRAYQDNLKVITKIQTDTSLLRASLRPNEEKLWASGLQHRQETL